MKRKWNQRLRQIYNGMKYRCYAPNLDERTARAYRDKGIRVCEEWLGYYGSFEDWALSNGYKDGLSIDRIDPNGNYCPENCRWITKSENSARVQRREQVLTPNPLTPADKEALIRRVETVKSILPKKQRDAITFLEGYVAGIKAFGGEDEDC